MNKGSPPTLDDALRHLNFIRNKRQEYFICLSLDSSGQIIRRRTVTIGLLNQSIVHPREVFAGPLKDRAAAVVIAHNHPSGCSDPSDADRHYTATGSGRADPRPACAGSCYYGKR